MIKAIFAPVTLAVFGLLATSCDWNSHDDYTPKHEYENFLKNQQKAEAERKTASAANPDGAVAPAAVPGKQTFETFCAACHGVDGKADGAAALAMKPQPRNFLDKAWQAKVTDEHIAKVIKEGGASVGLSATMAPWGAAINDEEIKNLVAYIRALGK